jgi:hypothetical protein
MVFLRNPHWTNVGIANSGLRVKLGRDVLGTALAFDGTLLAGYRLE